MSKRTYFLRYSFILKKLKVKPYSTYKELRDYIKSQFEYWQLPDEKPSSGIALRTLQRDLNDIKAAFGIDIKYDTSEKGYFIYQNTAQDATFQRMMEAFDVFNSLNLAQDLAPYIHLEQRHAQGTDNLHGFLHAIKNRLTVKFVYQKFWEDTKTNRVVAPYALKEFKNRWYLLAQDSKDNKVKSFSLDRMSEFEITSQKFVYPDNFNVQQLFEHYFGIITPEGLQPEEIILSFKPLQGKYIKTLPLHETQEILIDTDQELRVRLKLCITYDLMMELLSYGADMRVLAPQHLADQLRQAHQEAFSQY